MEKPQPAIGDGEFATEKPQSSSGGSVPARSDQPKPRRSGRRLPYDPRYAVKRTRRRRKGRHRKGTQKLVIISWRDIPAQVNGDTGDARVQRILPRRFHRAIDRAAMVADKTQASQYVAEWRRVVVPGDPEDPERAALAAAAALEEAFPIERLNRFVEAGGWDPDRDESAGTVEPLIAAIRADDHPSATRSPVDDHPSATRSPVDEQSDAIDTDQSHTDTVGTPTQEYPS